MTLTAPEWQRRYREEQKVLRDQIRSYVCEMQAPKGEVGFNRRRLGCKSLMTLTAFQDPSNLGQDDDLRTK